VPGGVLRGQSHLLESPVAAHLTIVDALNKVAGDAVAGGLLAAVLVFLLLLRLGVIDKVQTFVVIL
jgi:hypothetical protein